MQLSEFKNYELSEENVLLLYNRCKANEQTEKIIKVRVYNQELCGQDSPEVNFNGEKLVINADITFHMLGQLEAVHNKQPFMPSKQGFINYKGVKWTSKSSMLFALYALGIATSFLSPFVKYSNMNFSATIISGLEPTYPCDDPNYLTMPLSKSKFRTD